MSNKEALLRCAKGMEGTVGEFGFLMDPDEAYKDLEAARMLRKLARNKKFISWEAKVYGSHDE